jgi:hypothetical protein
VSEYVNALNAALYTAMTANASLGTLLASGTAIYFDQAPDAASLPYVVWSYAGGPGHENASRHETVDELVYVRGFAARPDVAGSISGQIDSTLHGKTLSVSGWVNFWTTRTQNISNVEIDSAQQKTWSRGSFYRVRLERTS